MDNNIQSAIKTDLPVTCEYKVNANSLFKYTDKIEYLIEILENKAIVPLYNLEYLHYLSIPGIDSIVFPMVCFCDVPLIKASYHAESYGQYGIGFYKDKILKLDVSQPIHYIQSNSPLMKDFKQAFEASLNNNEKDSALKDYLLSTLLYMKPTVGFNDRTNNTKNLHDECEWRYIPDKKEFENNDLDLILSGTKSNNKSKKEYLTILKKYPNTWLRFDWNFVKYIIVPDELEMNKIIDVILKLSGISDKDRYKLITKIVILKNVKEDFL